MFPFYMTLPKYLSFKPVIVNGRETPEARKHSSSYLTNSVQKHKTIWLQNSVYFLRQGNSSLLL